MMGNRHLVLYLVGLVAVTVNALAAPGGTVQDDSILKRQAPGTPQYDCHSNCGSTIAGARIEGHCSNSTWTEYYDGCLDCAIEFNIWDIYGKSVSAAGEGCGLSTTPAPASSASDSVPSSTTTGPSTEAPLASSTAISEDPAITSSETSPSSTSAPATPTTSVIPASAPALSGRVPVVEALLGMVAFVAMCLYGL